MKRYQYTIIKDGQRLDSLLCTEAEFAEWLKIRIDHKVFGRESYEEQVLILDATPAVLDEEGNGISEEIPAQYQTIVHPAEYEIEKIEVDEDVLATQLQQAQINSEAEAYLRETDWLIIREMDEGVPCPIDIKQERAAARQRIVR